MNKIINWLFGSFFRTLGRILVYILLAFVLSYILKGFKLPKLNIFDILYTNVSAETFTNNSYMTWQLNKNGNRLNYGNNPFYTSVDNLTDYGNYDLYLFYNNYTAYNNYFYDVTLTIYFDNPFIFANRVRSCNIYVEGSTNQTSDGCRVVDYTSSSLTIANYNIQSLTGTGKFTSQFTLPVSQNNEITVFQVNSFKLDIVAKEDKSITSETFGNAINNIIDNQNNNANNIINNQNQNTQDIIDNITDDSINEQGATDFVNGLDREYSSLTPFSDFINLPLRWIQSLFSSQNSCQPINLPLPYMNNKNLTLPCMTEFWQRMGSLGTLIQMVWIAIVGVRIFNGLFLLTCETLDPNPDKDMTKLRTWEL